MSKLQESQFWTERKKFGQSVGQTTLQSQSGTNGARGSNRYLNRQQIR